MKKIKYLFLLILIILIGIKIIDNNTDLKLFSLLDNKCYNQTNFKKNTLFVYFSLGCGECTFSISKLLMKYDEKVDIYLVSKQKDKKTIEFYIKQNHLNVDKNKVLIDKKLTFERYFKLGFVINYPTFIYLSNDKGKIFTNYKDLEIFLQKI